ncbi:MAG: UDP-N-acetylmuramoyl-L-alanyl-D-glutamate--2,6-diaminopimelate ligase [Deltaproteobacteria bacterium]|nr:UDP-N-acetylmuramoyl-L-alanyl-D-glutamate--2,6-diaminopimelate ligase [Deltaproteobacteria bacterium]
MQSYSAQQISEIIGGRLIGQSGATELRGVCCDSRRVRPGDIFVAIKGSGSDGHRHVSQAVSAGASLVVVSDEASAEGYSGVLVADTRRTLSMLASLFARNPSAKMQVIGITGTNGKTTTNWLLYHVLNALGHPCIRFGTLGTRAEGLIDRPGDLTTPDPLSIQNDLRTALNGGVTCAVMETSSHALDQCRIDDVAFDVGIFTNLTRDHLDYHATMDAYFQAKRKLFRLLSEGSKTTRAAVLNIDDEYGRKLQGELSEWNLKDFSFGRAAQAQFRIANFTQTMRGSELTIAHRGHEHLLKTSLIGGHNAQNLCAVFASCLALGLQAEEVISSLAKSPQVPGRLESVGQAPFGVFVDYAHTPDALENVLASLRPLTKGKLWVIFGCGGDRDRGKRPQMADVAQRLADHIVVTSDNPRTEDPQRIIDDILSGGVQPHLVTPDRRSAIESTLKQSVAGDVVLIAGKGHEDYQIIGTTKTHFSDQEVAREVLVSLGLSA